MPFKQVTEQDLKGKGVIGQPAVPGLSVTEMQKSVEQVVREAAIPAHNQLCAQLEAEAAAADIGAAVPGQGDMPPETPKKLQSVLEAMLAWAKEKLGLKADKASTYTKQQVDEAINEKVAAIGAGDMTMAVYDPESKKKPYMPAEEAMAKAVYDPQGEGVVAQARRRKARPVPRRPRPCRRMCRRRKRRSPAARARSRRPGRPHWRRPPHRRRPPAKPLAGLCAFRWTRPPAP